MWDDPLHRREVLHLIQKAERMMMEAQRARAEARLAEECGSMPAAATAGADGTPGSASDARTPPQTG